MVLHRLFGLRVDNLQPGRGAASPNQKMTLCTTLYGRIVSLPVLAAAGSVEFKLLKYDCVMHPRWHTPQ